ncbi:MAG: RidA family protein [Parvularculaceae bacterium]
MKKFIGEPLRLANGVILPLSRAVSANGFIFVSGQLGFDAGAKLAEGGIREQTHQALANIETILNAAGANAGDIVKVTGWLTREDDFPDFNDVYEKFFAAAPPPARSMVISRLLVPGALVELEAVAAVTA